MKKKSLILNIVIVLLTIFASIIMFTGIKLTSGAEPLLETSKIGMFKFFTVDSNIFMGLISLLFIIKTLKNKPKTKRHNLWNNTNNYIRTILYNERINTYKQWKSITNIRLVLVCTKWSKTSNNSITTNNTNNICNKPNTI